MYRKISFFTRDLLHTNTFFNFSSLKYGTQFHSIYSLLLKLTTYRIRNNNGFVEKRSLQFNRCLRPFAHGLSNTVIDKRTNKKEWKKKKLKREQRRNCVFFHCSCCFHLNKIDCYFSLLLPFYLYIVIFVSTFTCSSFVSQHLSSIHTYLLKYIV